MVEQYIKDLQYLKSLGTVTMNVPNSGKTKVSILIKGSGNTLRIESADILMRDAVKQLTVRVKSRRELIKEMTGVTDGIL